MRVFAIPDTHFPWVHHDALAWVYKQIELLKPDVVIQMGDLKDQYSHSRFARTHNLMTPAEETLEARLGAENMWKTIQRIAPNAECIQIMGNHDDRAEKRLFDNYPEIAHMLEDSIKNLYTFKGVRTIHDSSEELIIDGVLYIHGHLTKLGDHCKYFMQPVVHGHTHRGGIFYTRQSGNTLWELDCGYLADDQAVPMRYGPTRRLAWIHGHGLIDNGQPHFYHYPYPPKATQSKAKKK